MSQELYKIKFVLMPNCNANKVGTRRLNDVVIRVFVTSLQLRLLRSLCAM